MTTSETAYQRFLMENPDIYRQFSAVVQHPRHYRTLLNRTGFIGDATSMLSIGAGWGALELSLLEDHPALKLSFLDPIQSYADVFRADAEKRSLTGRVDEIAVAVFQDYSPQRTFDRILSIHSWYGLGFDAAILQKTLGMLSPGGKLFITIGAEDNLTYALARECFDATVNISAESLSAWAQQHAPHEYLALEHTTERSILFHTDGALTPAGQGFMAFHACTPYSSIPNETRAKFQGMLEAHCAGGDLRLTHGGLVFSRPT